MSALRTFLGASVIVAVGCGGSSSSDVGGDGSAGTGSSSGGSSTSSSSSSSSGGGDDSGSPTGGDDSGLSADDAGLGGMTMPPLGTDGGPGQIACGAAPCDSATQVCCAGGGGAGGRRDAGAAGGRMCTPTAACMGQALACSGTNSCSSGVCCAAATGRAGGATSTCEATCPTGSEQLCTTNADCTGAGETCRRIRAYPAYAICVAPGSMYDAGARPPRNDGGVPFPRGDGGVP